MNILNAIRKKQLFKGIALLMLLSFLNEILMPTAVYALTSGPAQEEFASFEPIATTDMVDLYSGDFTYNIPLLSVPGPNGGYPINLAYHSGVGMDQEASWVGLGWNVNVGAINRQLRGLPDDFNGDPITQKMHLKDNIFIGLDFPPTQTGGDPSKRGGKEKFGIPSLNETAKVTYNWQIYFNNYKGLGYRVGISPKQLTREYSVGAAKAGVGVGFYIDAQQGIGITPNISLGFNFRYFGFDYQGSGDINSRSGLRSVSVSSDLWFNKHKTHTFRDGSVSKWVNKVGVGAGSAISFSPGQVPNGVSIPMVSNSTSFDVKLSRKVPSVAIFRYKFPGWWTGSVEISKVKDGGNVATKSFGYLYTHLADNNSMKDFKRTEITYSKKVPNLGSSSFNYDLYTQSGQGTGSMFRSYRSDVGIVSDPLQQSKSTGVRTNLEFGIEAPDIHIGVGVVLNKGVSVSGNWQARDNHIIGEDNQLNLSYTSDFFPEGISGSRNPNYESSYFQLYGDKTAVFDSDDQLKTWGGSDPVRVKLSKKGDWSDLDRRFVAEKEFINGASSSLVNVNASNYNVNVKRQRRSTNIQTLTKAQTQQFGMQPDLLTNLPVSAQSHHIAEMTMLQPDGMRYIYGLPAYNTEQVDALFSASDDVDFNTRYVDVPPGGFSTANEGNQYQSKTNTPAYAHSWLLTTVVSSDYVDRENDGPTEDDYGYWVKFNYKKNPADYHWRIPYGKAVFMEGNKSDPKDNLGSYQFGAKQLYYIESIETKTHIAIFDLTDRDDGIGAKDETTGGLPNSPASTQRMKKLDKISLFTKADYQGGNNLNAIPIKTVHFDYNYNLCPGAPNNINGGGKLTLEKVFFTYNNSTKGQLSPYKFVYASGASNPSYNDQNYDRWGNYKPNTINYPHSVGSPNAYPFIDLPYTDQNTPPIANAWSLEEIHLPTGGVIKVEYESDDYAYVENKKAMQMFDIQGTFDYNTGSIRTSSAIQHSQLLFPATSSGHYRVFFDLEQSLPTNLTSALARSEFVQSHYVRGIQKVYFKIFSDLRLATDPDRFSDYVSGYADVATPGAGELLTDYIGATQDLQGNYTRGYITLKKEPIKTAGVTVETIHPFQLAAFRHLRMNRPELVHDLLIPNVTSDLQKVLKVFDAILGNLTDIGRMIAGFDVHAFNNVFGATIQLNGRSIIKLHSPDGKKYGGGTRVKKLTISDRWSDNNTTTDNPNTPQDEGAPDNFNYGQTYNYTIEENGENISSGVAYEPQVGGDESALREPINYKHSTPLASPVGLFVEKPVLESFYPGPSVGYRKVIVKSLASETVDKTAAPISTYEFYTPKDFPVITSETDINGDPAVFKPIVIPGFYSSFKKRMGRSQGYVVELNDMAGKMKSLTVTTEPTTTNPKGTLISKQEYVYFTEREYSEAAVNKLFNKVQVLTTDGQYVTATMGQSHDIWIDMNENKQTGKTPVFPFDLNFEYLFPVIFVLPIPIPYVSKTESSFRSAVTMKAIYHTGIIKEIITTTEESVIKTENLAFDAETGEALLTKVTNEFKDPVFNYSYPAHWYYENTSGAYKNYGITLSSSNVSSVTAGGRINITNLPSGKNVSDYFIRGDELAITIGPSIVRYHVVEVDVPGNYIRCVDHDGDYIGASAAVNGIRVIRSGRKNLQILKAGTLVAKNVSGFSQAATTTPTAFTYSGIIDATAVEYADHWGIFCGTQSFECGELPGVGKLLDFFNDPYIKQHYLACTGAGKAAIGGDYVSLVTFSNECIGNSGNSSSASIADLNGTEECGESGNCNVTFPPPPGSQSGTCHTSSQNLALTCCDSKRTAACMNGIAGTSEAALLYATAWCTLLGHSPCTGLQKVDGIAISISKDGVQQVEITYTIQFPDGPSCFFTLTFEGTRSFFYDDVLFFSDLRPDPDFTNQGTNTHFIITAHMSDGTTVNLKGDSCIPLFQCNEPPATTASCGIQHGDIVNPYTQSILGNWRPVRSYAFITERDYAENKVSKDGPYKEFQVFPWANPGTKSPKWVESKTVTKYSPFAFELENKDALGRFSAAYYGYDNTLVTAVGANTKYREMGSDGFEDYINACAPHFQFEGFDTRIIESQAHTGLKSMVLESGEESFMERSVKSTDCNGNQSQGGASTDDAFYRIDECDCIEQFTPIPGKKYVLSAWTKEVVANSPVNSLLTYEAAQVTLEFYDAGGNQLGTSLNYLGSGKIIDGWQRVFSTFDIPANTAKVIVRLINTSNQTSVRVFFDDIRIHPFDANITAYVYNAITLKLMAELDANNYATYYIYDQEGTLVQIKKETIEGVKTIKEVRTSTRRQ